MEPFDTGDAEESFGPIEFEFPITRRTFLGSVGAMTVASAAFGQDEDKSDETALRFAWSNDPEAEGARVLDISIVTRERIEPDKPENPAATATTATPPPADTVPSEFADIIEQSRGRTRDRFWRLRPESFGPRVYFALKTRKSDKGLLIYELRVADVSYGRLKPRPGQRRSITFIFTQNIMPLPGDPETKVKRFVLTATTDIWSSERGPAALRTFEMSGKVDNDIRHPLLFRDFIIQPDPDQVRDHSNDLFIDVPLRRITNTAALMFNGLITARAGVGNPSVDLWFSSSGVWHVRSERAALAAFGGRVALSELDIFWPTVANRESGADSEAPLFGAATPDWASSQRIEIGDGRHAPGFRGTWDEKTKRVFFRMQAPEGAPKATNELRAEAMLQSEWKGVSFEGRNDLHSAGRLPVMVGSLLERADHADVLDNAFPAANSGSVSFQARYGRRSDTASRNADTGYVRTETPIGQLVTQAIRDGDVENSDEDFSFPKRRGWPVTVLFDWPGQAGGTRTKPVTQLIDAEVGIVEAGVALPGAQYSRLTFAPSALRIFYSRHPLERPPIGSFLDLAPRKGAEFARLDLSRAALRASRSENLLALKFGFSDLALSFRDDGQEFVSYNTSCDITTRSGDFDALQPHDTRPTLVVEFPPQHLFEEARFFQTAPPLPDVEIKQKLTFNRQTKVLDAAPYENETPPPFSVTDTEIVFDSDNRVHLSDAIATLLRAGADPKPFREEVAKVKREKSKGNAQTQFKEFGDWLVANKNKAKKPNDNSIAHQFVYVGPVGMDVDVRQYVRKMFDAYWQSKAKPIVDKMLTDALGHAGRIKPETEVESFDEATRIALQVEGMLPLYQRYRDFWREQMVSLLIAPDTAAPAVRKLVTADRPKRSDPTEIEHVPLSAARTAELVKTLDAGILDRRAAAVTLAFRNALFQRDNLALPSRARLANPSRLAFRVNCRDGLDAIRTRRDLDLDQPEDFAQRLPRESLPFHLDTLTTFQGMELAVTARAEIVYDPGELGLISARRPRIADTSGDAMLARLGFRMDNETSARSRLADIATSLKPPSALETAIEIPARLTLSPHQNAVVLTPRRNLFEDRDGDAFDYDPPAGEPKQRAEKPVIRETETLWQAQFVTEADGLGLNPGLRAVHSPDLRPGALLIRFAEQHTGMPFAEPPGGAFDPWFLSLIHGQSPTMSQADLDQLAHLQIKDEDGNVVTAACDRPPNELPGLVARLCAFFRERNTKAARDITRFRGPMDARDRHQLVLLSSAWGLPVIGRRDEGGMLKRDSSQFEPTSRSAVWDVMPGSAIYQPRTLNVTELALSGIGGTLRHDTGFQPPAGALFWQDNAPIFDALGIERWQQWTNLGRDIYTEIVYKGFLFPLGLRASLVKVTERIFHMDIVTGAISAPLRQRMYIRVADPEKLYPAVKQPFGGRRFPVKRLNLLTTTTPDIADPNDDTPVDKVVGAHGRIGLGDKGRGIAFWPRMFGAEAGNIRFEMDVDGVKTDLPLIFVDNTAANHQDSLKELVAYYATVASPENGATAAPVRPTTHIRTLIFGGAERRYAEEVETGGATFQTDHWTLSATGLHEKIDDPDPRSGEAFETFRFNSASHVFGPTLQGADQPPFYPVMETARVHLTQTERLIGRTLPPVRAHFDARYLAHGFVAEGSTAEASTLINPVPKVNASEVVLILRDQSPLDMGRKGDQSGGVYRPSGVVAALSRSKGALTQAVSIPLPDISTSEVNAFSGLFTLPQGSVPALDNSALPTGTEGQSQNPVEQAPNPDDAAKVLEEIREIYKTYLGDGSKILGLVSLRELIDLIQRLSSPDEGLPDLSEKTEFGAGLLQGVEDAATVIRERIVAPLAAAVRRIRDGWDEIETQLNEGQSRIGVPVKPVTISEIFPELDNALTQLADALARAEGETDEIAFALELGACYSSGQQFLGSLERAAANPGQRVEEALSSRYTEVLGLFRALRDGIGPWLTNMAIRAIWRRIDPNKPLPPGNLTSFDLEEIVTAGLAERIEAAVKEALSAAVDKGGELTREIIRLPRTSGVYEAPGQAPNDRFLNCLQSFVPDDKDIGVVLDALAAWLLDSDRVISFFNNGVPKPNMLLTGFLDDTATTLEFDEGQENKITKFFENMSGTVGEHINEQIDELATRIVGEITKVETAKNIDLSDLKDEILAMAEEVKADLHTANGRVFEGTETDATKALRTGSVRTQIRNRYIACVVLNMIADPEDCIPDIVDLDPEWLRDFFRWLRSFLRMPNDDLPDLPNIFQPILDLMHKAFQLLAELARLVKELALDKDELPDFRPLLALLRRIFEQISIPGLPEDLCKAIKPAWDGAAYTMRAVADLGEVLTHPRPGTNGIVFHPPDWTGPACPFGDTSQARHVDASWNVIPFSKAHPNSLNASIFAIRAYTDVLKDITGRNVDAFKDAVTAGQLAQKDLFDAYESLIADFETKLEDDLRDKLPAAIAAAANETERQRLRTLQRSVNQKIDLLQKSIDQTRDTMSDLSKAAGIAHCSLSDASDAIARLSADLRRAAALPICGTGGFDETAFDALKAMAHLPGDVRSARDRIEKLSEDMRVFVQTLVDTIKGIANTANTEPVVLLVLAVPVGPLLDGFTLTSDSTQFQTEIEAANSARDKLRAWVAARSDQTVPLVREITKTLCRAIDQVDALRASLEARLDEAEIWIKRAEAALDDGTVTEPFRPLFARLLDEIRRGVDPDRRRADMVEVRKVFDVLRDIRDFLCKNPDGSDIKPDPAVPLAMLSAPDVKVPGSEAQILSKLGEIFADQIKRLTGATNRLTSGLQPLVDELRQFTDTEPRKVLQTALTPYVKLLIAQRISVPDSSLTDGSGTLTLASLYAVLKDLRNDAYTQLEVLPAADILQEAFVVPPDGARQAVGNFNPSKFASPNQGKNPSDNDQLSGDVAWLKKLSAAPDTKVTEAEMHFLSEFTREWASGEATPLVIFEQIVELVDDILSGGVFKNIDFARIREEVEDFLLSLVPSKIRMGYGFNIELGDEVAKATAGIFAPKPGTRLGIDMKIVIDLLKATQGDIDIDFRSVGTLGPFDIKLVGKMFDALTLSFASAEFVTEGGGKSDIRIVYTDHKIGPQLKFVEKLQKYLAPKDGSGAIIRFYPNQPGLEAGYRLHLGDFSVGNLAFTNVGLETTAILPFSDSEALFKASLSSRPNPFTLTYAPYGGSGFFAIFATVEGIVGFEASFEFGGSGVFAAGPLSGQGRIMSGVYIRQLKLNGVKITEISMTFFAGGSASIWIFNFAAALSVKLGMINGNMTGEATFSFSFSMGLADFEYSITMVKQEGEGFQGQTASLGPTRTASLADPALPHQKQNTFGAIVETAGQCQSRNWTAFKSYFDDTTDLGNYF